MRFFHTANASRATKLPDGRRVTFEIYRFFGGSWLGIAAVEDESIIAGLDELVRKPKSGITSITEAEYKDALKKKLEAVSFKVLPESPRPPQPKLAVNDKVGVAAEEAKRLEATRPGSAPAPAVPRVFDDLNEVLKPGKVLTANLSTLEVTKPKSKKIQEALEEDSA